MQGMRGALVAIELETAVSSASTATQASTSTPLSQASPPPDYSKLRDNPTTPFRPHHARPISARLHLKTLYGALAVLNAGVTNWREIIRDYGRFQLPKDDAFTATGNAKATA